MTSPFARHFHAAHIARIAALALRAASETLAALAHVNSAFLISGGAINRRAAHVARWRQQPGGSQCALLLARFEMLFKQFVPCDRLALLPVLDCLRERGAAQSLRV